MIWSITLCLEHELRPNKFSVKKEPQCSLCCSQFKLHIQSIVIHCCNRPNTIWNSVCDDIPFMEVQRHLLVFLSSFRFQMFYNLRFSSHSLRPCCTSDIHYSILIMSVIVDMCSNFTALLCVHNETSIADSALYRYVLQFLFSKGSYVQLLLYFVPACVICRSVTF